MLDKFSPLFRQFKALDFAFLGYSAQPFSRIDLGYVVIAQNG
jgi:hypothetical protein